MHRALAIVLIWLALTSGRSLAGHFDALAVAAQDGDTTKVAALIEAGADPNDYRRTYSALMYAAGNGHASVVGLLLAHGARVDHRDHNGDRALLWAAARGHAEVVRLLLGAGAAVDSADDPYRIKPLMKASENGHLEVVRLLLAAGADPRRHDHVDDTALHGAALSGNAELVALLLRAGARPNVRSRYIQETPLHLAATRGDAATVALLIRAGADVAARDYKGRTALWRAAALDHVPVVAALLAARADPDARDAAGVVPFVAAADKSGAAARLLVERTEDLDRAFVAAMWGGHGELALRLAARGADIDAVDEVQRSALAAVVRHPGTAMLEWLVAQHANLARHGAAALHGAGADGRLDLLRTLLDAGVPVDARTTAGTTSLMHAAGAGKVEAVRLLLARDADRDAHDADGRGVRDYMRKRTDMVAGLIQTRNMSRAYHATGHLKAELAVLAESHAAIEALLAR